MREISSPPRGVGPVGLPGPTRPWLLAAWLLLAGCTGSVDAPGEPGQGPLSLSGFAGSPSLVDATVTLMSGQEGTTIATRSGSDAAYTLNVEKLAAPPLRLQLEGGRDLLTGGENRTTLNALSFAPRPERLSVSHLSTLAATMAACGGNATEGSLAAGWNVLRRHTGLPYLPEPASPDARQIGELMRANVVLAESLARTRSALAGGPLAGRDPLDGIACDLADDGRLNLSAPQADARLISVYLAVEAGVLLEMMGGTPYLDAQPAAVALDQALRRVSGDPNATLGDLTIPDALPDRARAGLALLLGDFPDPELLDLMQSLSAPAGNLRDAVGQALSASRLVALWSLGERLALADDALIRRLADRLRAQEDTPAPLVSLSAAPQQVNAGEAATLSWASARADVCRADGDWSGFQPLTGTWRTGSLGRSSDFRLACAGPGGLTQASVQVSVLDPGQRPVVSLNADDQDLRPGEATTIRWSTVNADSCTASGAWSGARPVVGSERTADLVADAEYTLTCSGPAGSDAATVRVSVTPAPVPGPTLSLSASPASIQSGESTTLSWSTTNADACQASGGWSGSRAPSGTRTLGPLTADTGFSLSCSGPGGTVTRTVTVSVAAPPPGPTPTVTLSAASDVVDAGTGTTLTWSATDAETCTASGGWTGARATFGTAATGPLSARATFSLSCSGAGGSALAMVSVRVNGSIDLTWAAPTENVDGTPLTDLAGYRVYYGEGSRAYDAFTEVTDPTATSTDIPLPSGDYYVAMTALDQQGNESAYSNEVVKTVP